MNHTQKPNKFYNFCLLSFQTNNTQKKFWAHDGTWTHALPNTGRDVQSTELQGLLGQRGHLLRSYIDLYTGWNFLKTSTHTPWFNLFLQIIAKFMIIYKV